VPHRWQFAGELLKQTAVSAVINSKYLQRFVIGVHFNSWYVQHQAETKGRMEWGLRDVGVKSVRDMFRCPLLSFTDK
jgi:hypothetical protein